MNWHHEGRLSNEYDAHQKHSCGCGIGRLGTVMYVDAGIAPQPELHPDGAEHAAVLTGSSGSHTPLHSCSTQHRSPPKVRSCRNSHQPGALFVSP
jgi:hypothetical protein